MLKAVIFDMDGVLIDSTKYIWGSFNIILKKFGINFSNKDIKRYLGCSLRDQLRMWKEEYNFDYSLDKFSREAWETQFKLIKKDLHFNKSLNIFLQELKINNIKLAVATSSMKFRAEKILQVLQIRDFFDVLVTAEDVKKHKPNPDIFLEAAKQLNEKPADCVVFEDAVNGVRAAIDGGMKVVAVKTKFHTNKELKSANIIIKDFSAINLEKIKELF